jgi:hypothetical protein
MNPPPPTSPAEQAAPEQQVLGLARPLALLFGGVVVVSGGLGWGQPGAIAAGIGTAVSLANVWVLHGLGARAVRQAGDQTLSPDVGTATQAAVGLQVALGVKTVILLVLVALLANRSTVAGAMTPFTLGLLVTVFALLAGGLLAPLAARFRRFSDRVSQTIS